MKKFRPPPKFEQQLIKRRQSFDSIHVPGVQGTFSYDFTSRGNVKLDWRDEQVVETDWWQPRKGYQRNARKYRTRWNYDNYPQLKAFDAYGRLNGLYVYLKCMLYCLQLEHITQKLPVKVD